MSNIDLRLGDCLELMKTLPDNSVDLTVTSPPYDNLRTYNNKIKTWSFEKFQEIAKELYRVTASGGYVVWIVNDAVIKGSESGTSFRQALYFKECGFSLHDTMIWNKQSSFTWDHTRYYQSFEYMFVFVKGKPRTVNLIRDKVNAKAGKFVTGSTRTAQGDMRPSSGRANGKRVSEFGIRYNVWNIFPVMSPRERTGHPAQFPERLAKDHITTWSNKNDTVLDPFMGSGTTGKAALELGRRFIGFEIDEEYFKIAEERIKQNVQQSNIVRTDDRRPEAQQD